MRENLLRQLRTITKEEQQFLDGDTSVQKEIYASGPEFVVDSEKMLQHGKLISIRPHARFVHFPQHSHNYVEIIYMCSGSTTHIINDTSRVVLKQGDLLFLNRHAKQEILPAGKDDIAVNFIVLPEFFDTAFSMMEGDNIIQNFLIDSLRENTGSADYLHFMVSDVPPIQNLMENLIWSLLNPQGSKRHLNQVTMGLLFLHLLNYTDRIDRRNPVQYEQSQVFFILRYIEEHYKDASLSALAQKMNQPLPQLSRFVKTHTGPTFKELLQTRRLKQAAYLLSHSAVPVEDIISAVGYDNTSYFHRIFKEAYGMTPRQYRLQNALHLSN